jgi:hypothetical protein
VTIVRQSADLGKSDLEEFENLKKNEIFNILCNS